MYLNHICNTDETDRFVRGKFKLYKLYKLYNIYIEILCGE